MARTSARSWGRLRAGAGVLVLATLLSACGSGSDDDGDSGASVEAASTRTVEHAYGEVEVPADPQRVVVLWSRGLPELADALDVPLVGSTTDGGTLSPLVSEETAAEVTSVGETAEPDLEEVAALEPDLVVAFDITVPEGEAYEQWSTVAPTYILPGSILFELPWREVVQQFARGVSREERADELLADIDARIADLRPQLEERYRDETFGIVAQYEDGTPAVLTPTHVAGSVLADLGLQRPAGHQAEPATIDLSPERLLEADADHLVYFYWGYTGEPSELVANPLWPQLGAVQAGQAREVDGQAWTVPVPTAVDVMLDDVERLFLGPT